MARGSTRKARGTSKTDGPKKKGGRTKPPASVTAQALAGNVPDDTYRIHLDALMQLRGDMKKRQEELNAARGAYRARMKVAKSDGCNIDAIAAALVERDKDQTERKLYYRDFGRVLRMLNVPVGTQLGLFDGDADVKAMDGDGPMTPDMAEKAGYDACRAGVPNSNNQFEAGTEEHQRWRIGWDKACEETFAPKRPAARGIGQSAVAGNA